MEIVENLNRCYLKKDINIEEKEGQEKYRFRMIQKNKISGLLQVDQRNLDGCVYLYYDITGMQSMKKLQCVIDVHFMDKFVSELERLLLNLEAYLLQQGEVCLLPECIWSDSKTEKWRFMYIPGLKKEQKADMEHLLEFIMDHVDCSDEEGLERFYDFYSDVLQGEFPSIREFIKLWQKGENTPSKVQSRGIEEEKLPEESEILYVRTNKDSVFEYKRGRGCKERIYLVPFHGTKVGWREDVALT